MVATQETIDTLEEATGKYKYGFVTDIITPGGQRVVKPKPQVPEELVFDESGRRQQGSADGQALEL